MKYYDKTQELKYRHLDKILRTGESKYKLEKRDFLSNHRYILNAMNEIDAQCVIMYYGLDDGNFKSYDLIARGFECGKENIRRRIIRGMEKIGTHPYIDLLAEFTDQDLEYSEENKEEFDEKRLNELYDLIVMRDQKNEMHRLSKLSKEDKKAEFALDALLRMRFFSVDWVKRFDRSTILKYEDETFEDILTKFDQLDFQNPRNQSIIEIMKKLKLEFLFDYEYIKDWKNACIEGIKEYGIDKLMKSFGLVISNDTKMASLLSKSTDILNFNVRVRHILSYNKIRTIADLISFKESQIYKLRKMGPDSISDLKTRLREKGLELCPENLSSSEWINIVLNCEKQEEVEEIIDSPVQKKTAIDELLSTAIDDMEFSSRVKNRFRYNHIDTLENLVVWSINDIYKMRNLGNQSIEEIISVLAKYDLQLRPEDMNESEWLEKIRDSYNSKHNAESEQKDMCNDKPIIDLQTIPEDLRQYVCRGVGETIKDEISNSTYDILIHKAKRNYQTKIIPEADNPTFERVKYDCNDAENSLD